MGGGLSAVNAPGYGAAMGGAATRPESRCCADGVVLGGMGQPQQGKGEGGHQRGLAQGSKEWAVGGGRSTVNAPGYVQPFRRVGSVHPGRAETASRKRCCGECERNCPSSPEFRPGVAQVTWITLLARPAAVKYICSGPGPHWFGVHLRAPPLPSLLAPLPSLLTPHRLSLPAAVSPCPPPSLVWGRTCLQWI